MMCAFGRQMKGRDGNGAESCAPRDVGVDKQGEQGMVDERVMATGNAGCRGGDGTRDGW